jgi:hypothetical protein
MTDVIGNGEHVTDLFIAWIEQQRGNVPYDRIEALEAAYRAGYVDAHTEMRQANGDGD